ncbi:MAG: 50S ribosomal protein L17 [Candidatus Omnitrophica bacterium]|nr:50S ribosomal protein L17 [Candidatus Omnitrophota bacterium]
MPHAVYTRNLARSRSWRKATVQSLAQALIAHERIETTFARAKETQRLVERLITLGKKGSLADRRQAIRLLNDSRSVHRLFSDVAPRFASRPGGYTRIVHGGFRAGDGASLAVIELVERAPAPTEEKKAKGKKDIAPARRFWKPGPKRGEEDEAVSSEKEEEKPSPRPPKAEEEAPAAEQPSNPPAKESPEKEAAEEKPKGFIGGLRRFFKNRQKE